MEVSKKNRRKQGFDNDIYTSLLGLAALVLVATTVMVCARGYQIYGEIFRLP